MKATQLVLTFLLLASAPIISKAQDKPKLQYTVGFGPSIDNSIYLYGLNLSNELNVGLGKRTSFNAGVSFYQSLGSYKDESWEQELGQKNEEQSSGIFITPSLKFDLVQRPSGFILALAAGPSLQLGGQTYLFDLNSYGSDTPSPTYSTSKFQRVGWLLELEAEWKTKNPNVKNAASISAFGADKTFPWYINLTYKVRFGLGKN